VLSAGPLKWEGIDGHYVVGCVADGVVGEYWEESKGGDEAEAEDWMGWKHREWRYDIEVLEWRKL
jgi:hypothetical protein